MVKLTLNPRAKAGRFIRDRHWYGGNPAKGAKTAESKATLEICLLGKLSIDSQEHWLRECPHPVQHTIMVNVTVIGQISTDFNGHRVSTGNWLVEQI